MNKIRKCHSFFEILHHFFDFFENWTWGYVLGPKKLFSSMLVPCALITTCFQKKYFWAPPRAIHHIFGHVVFLYPPEAPRGRHGQVPKLFGIFFLHHNKSLLSTLRVLTFGFRKNQNFQKIQMETTLHDAQDDMSAPWRRYAPPRMRY